ncbi:hypothetical protein [Actinomyces procaprae]|uniref:hypothetical protein n=1 Tax=Actinomyces procaprae TaxID=2560010 RepID=UPI00109DC347|nr:hypothetical protein [Actinomyces procaprae]
MTAQALRSSQASTPACPPLPAGCRAASRQSIAASIGIDLAVVVLPLTLGLVVPGPALLRLLLVLVATGLLLAQTVTHCLYGRAVGGMVLGLLTVDADAGLPTGTARSLLPLLHLGPAAGATVLDVREGPDPSRVTLDELDELAAQSASVALPYSSQPQPQQPAPTRQPQPQQPAPTRQPQPQQPAPTRQPQPQQPAPTQQPQLPQPQPAGAPSTVALPSRPPHTLRAVSAHTPSMIDLPPSVPLQAPPPPPPPEPTPPPAISAPRSPAPAAPAPPPMTRKALRALEREQERARAQRGAGIADAEAPGPERMVG